MDAGTAAATHAAVGAVGATAGANAAAGAAAAGSVAVPPVATAGTVADVSVPSTSGGGDGGGGAVRLLVVVGVALLDIPEEGRLPDSMASIPEGPVATTGIPVPVPVDGQRSHSGGRLHGDSGSNNGGGGEGSARGGDVRVLLAQRPAGKANAGLWEFPGGKVDAGETPEAALVRELQEELGIAVSPTDLHPLTFASHSYPTFHLLMPLYVCSRWQGTPRGAEGQAVVWVTAEEVAAYPLTPADIPLVPAVLAAMRGAGQG